MKKEKKIVDVESSNKEKKNYSINNERQIVNVAASDKSSAKGKRIGAVILWLLGITCEVLAVLNVFGKLELPKLSQTVWLIILIVVDLIFVVIGSQLWKKANHIDPASEKNKTKFWLWNNLGSIISVVAFLPLIIIVLTNKDMDKKTKGIVSAVAAVALLIGGLSSYDWNPVSSEQLESARQEILANGGYDTNDAGDPVVYWLEHSKKYHINSDCPAINRSNTSDTIKRGTIDAAYENGLTEPCRICIKAMEKIQSEKKTGE